MTVDLEWDDQDILDAEEDHGEQVAENLEKKLDKREDETQYYSNLPSYRNRFHNSFQLTEELMISELRFSANSKEWRGICIEIEKDDKVVYFDLCSKNNQDQFLDYMKKNSDTIFREIESAN